MNQLARGRRCALIPATLVAVACGEGGPSSETAQPDRTAEAMAALEANPCDAGSNAALADSTLAALLTGVGHVENEIYDCQRLVISVGAEGEFGPLVALFPMDGTLGLARSSFASPQPAVTIYSWGAAASAAGGDYVGGYPDLEIDPGSHCLWLRNATDTDTGWSGAIMADAPCGSDASPPPEAAFRNTVIERVYQGTEPDDYPKTARWEWDLNTNKQFIGVRCGDAWCGVLAAGAEAPRTRPLVGGRDEARESVPGWSDAQHLAVFDSTEGRARPGTWASLVSYSDLQAESPPWAEGLMGARIRVYGTPRDTGHELFVQRFYLQPEAGFARGDLILRFPGFYDEAWYQQGPMRRRQAMSMQYAPTPMHQVGAARWRWRENGETIWIFCPSGSCHVDQ